MNNKALTLGSLFDGSGGFPLGGMLCGITPVWASEIEPFPIRVTTKRMPNVKHYGDISKMDGGKIEPVDIITFGSPCQDMSVAGKRAGLDGSRSNLFYEAIRIIKEMRCATNGKYPRYIVWENVPGAFSSNKGDDFHCVLQSICQAKDERLSVPRYEKWPSAGNILGDDFSIAWRVLDAQFWGVPQRRKRIFLVADFTGGSAGQILFESEGLSRYSAESFRAWQRTTCRAENGIDATGFDGYNGSLTDRVSATLGVNCGMSTGRNGIVLNDQGGSRMDVTEDFACPLRAEAHHPPCVLESAGFCTEHSAKSRTIGYEEELSPTLRAGVVPATVYENHSQDTRYRELHDVAPTVSSTYGTGGNNQPFVVSDNTPYTLKIRSGCEGGGKGALIQSDKSATLATNNDQTLFEPCAWDGGQVSPTLTKQNAGGNQRMPDKDNFNCVVGAFGICSKDSNAMKSSNPHSGVYKADSSRTLDGNGGNPTCNQGGIAVVCVDQGGGKSGCNVSVEQSPTLTCTHGGEPAVCVKGDTFVIEGNGTRPSHKGDGYKESDVMYTLNTVDRHAVYSMTTGSYLQTAEEQAPTLLARDYKDPTAVAYGIGRDTFNQGKNAQFMPSFSEEVQPTMVAKGPGAVAQPYGFDPSASRDVGQYCLPDCGNTLVNGSCPGHHNGVINNDYTVRRLTPTECARLQGFPDWWCSDLGIAESTMEDIRFWYDVFETHRKITKSSTKPKSLKQIAKWLKDPHSDAAEYKMWGNGVALPCVYFVLSGIVFSTQNEGENKPI